MFENTDIPTTDEECWIKYPKFRWMYETTKLLESQNKKWSFVKDNKFNCVLQMTSFNRAFNNVFLKYSSTIKLGEIYVEDADNINAMHTDVLIQKGEIKWFTHHLYGQVKKNIDPSIELRITAFIIMHFSKWNGVVSIKTIDNVIYAVKLMPSELLNFYPEDVKKEINKIYKIKS